MPTNDNLTIEQQIQSQRKQIEEQEKQIYPVTTKRISFIPREVRESRRQAGAELGEFASKFETQVAEQMPEQARPEYLENAYQKAVNRIKPQIDRLETAIEDRQDKIKTLQERQRQSTGKDWDNIQNQIESITEQIDSLDAKRDSLKGSLEGSKADVVKKVLSGEAESRADYEVQKISAQQERRALTQQYIKSEQAKGNLIIKDEYGNIVGALAKTDLPENYSYYVKDGTIKSQDLERVQKIETQLYERDKAEYDRIQKVLPTSAPGFVTYDGKVLEPGTFTTTLNPQRVVDTQTGQTVAGYSTQVMINPATGKVIDDIEKYYKENKIPTDTSKVMSESERMAKIVEGTYKFSGAEAKQLGEISSKIMPSLTLQEKAASYVQTGFNELKDIIKGVPQVAIQAFDAAKGGAYLLVGQDKKLYVNEKDLNKFYKFAQDKLGYRYPYLIEDIGKHYINPYTYKVAKVATIGMSLLPGGQLAAGLTSSAIYGQESLYKGGSNANILSSILVGGASTYLFGKGRLSTKAALALEYNKINSITDPMIDNKTKLANIKDVAITLGISAATSFGLGAGMKLSEDALTAMGYKVLAKILASRGPQGYKIIRNIAGLSLVGAGKATKFGVETYFKSQMIGAGYETTRALETKNMEKFSLNAAELVGGLAFIPGEYIGKKAFDIGSFLTGTKVPTRIEYLTVKKAPSAIQAEIQTSAGDIYVYRRGPIKTGFQFEPRLDKYLSKTIKQPTPSVFFRTEETIGVKGGKIYPALSVPSFVQPPSYTEMFFNNLRISKGNLFRKIISSFAETPVLSDVLAVGRYKVKPLPTELKNKMLNEYATTGKLSKSTQKELLKYDSTISDKLREFSFFEEQEAVFRKTMQMNQNVKIGFTRRTDGTLLPVLYEKTTLKPRLNTLLNKKIITEQDAKFIQRQYNMWQKYKEKYVLPKEHAVKHAQAVSSNIRKIINVYPEFHSYLIKKYGSLEKAVKNLELAAKFHDIGKTSESSREYGVPHGKKFYQVWKSKLLPSEAQVLPKSLAKAIKTHETIAGTKLGVYGPKYLLGEFIEAYTPEQKILATADRLDLMRYGMDVKGYRLPLSDALRRLGLDKNYVKKEPIAEKLVKSKEYERLTPKIKPKVYEKYKEERTTPSKYFSLTKYEMPYKKIKSYPKIKTEYKISSEYKTPYTYKMPYVKLSIYKQTPYKYKEPVYKKPSYKVLTPSLTMPSRMLDIEKRKRKPLQQEKLKPRRFQLLPTLAQKVFKEKKTGKELKRTEPLKLSQITGFEVLRI